MKVCYLPKFLLIPFGVVVIMGGLVYGMIMGVVTGFYEVAVGGAFVVVGFAGIAAGLIRSQVTAGMYMLGFCVVWLGALTINIMGIIKPKSLATFETEIEIGDFVIAPTWEWFLGALVFAVVGCTPCMCCAICNCATTGNLVRWKKERRQKKKEKMERKEKMRPVVQPLHGKTETWRTDGRVRRRNEEKKEETSVEDVVVERSDDVEACVVEQPDLVEAVEEFSDVMETDG